MSNNWPSNTCAYRVWVFRGYFKVLKNYCYTADSIVENYKSLKLSWRVGKVSGKFSFSSPFFPLLQNLILPFNMQICFDMSQNWKLPLRPFVKSGATVFIITKQLWKFPHSIPSLPCPLGRPALLRLCGCLQDEAEQGDMCSSYPLSHTLWIGRYLLLFWKCILLCFMKFWLSYFAAIVLALLVGTHFVPPFTRQGLQH